MLDARDVDRVRVRMIRLEEALRAALKETTRASVDDVIDAARWTRLEVDAALALKGHVADLGDAAWSRMAPRDRVEALGIFARFLQQRPETWDLVGVRNLRARLDGLLTATRVLAAR